MSLSYLFQTVLISLSHTPSDPEDLLFALNCKLVEKTYLICFSAYTPRNKSLKDGLVLLVIFLISISETKKLNQNPQLKMKTSVDTTSPMYCSYQIVTLIIIWIWNVFQNSWPRLIKIFSVIKNYKRRWLFLINGEKEIGQLTLYKWILDQEGEKLLG